jgi:hypothetical protein
VYSQHHTKWEKIKPFPLKSGIRQWDPRSPFLFSSLGIPRQSNKTGRRNERNTNWKGSSQIIPIVRWYDHITKR